MSTLSNVKLETTTPATPVAQQTILVKNEANKLISIDILGYYYEKVIFFDFIKYSLQQGVSQKFEVFTILIGSVLLNSSWHQYKIAQLPNDYKVITGRNDENISTSDLTNRINFSEENNNTIVDWKNISKRYNTKLSVNNRYSKSDNTTVRQMGREALFQKISNCLFKRFASASNEILLQQGTFAAPKKKQNVAAQVRLDIDSPFFHTAQVIKEFYKTYPQNLLNGRNMDLKSQLLQYASIFGTYTSFEKLSKAFQTIYKISKTNNQREKSFDSYQGHLYICNIAQAFLKPFSTLQEGNILAM